jgi:hypothetical protein
MDRQLSNPLPKPIIGYMTNSFAVRQPDCIDLCGDAVTAMAGRASRACEFNRSKATPDSPRLVGSRRN